MSFLNNKFYSKYRYLLTLLFLFTGRLVIGQVTHDSLTNIKVYSLGEVVISSSIDKEKLSLNQILKFNNLDVATAIDKLPSVVYNNIGSRNEGSVAIRGFDPRSVPVFLDGIPVYVPYDGYVDLSRFSVMGISQIEVSKGFSSMVLGPNTLGGAINLVSMQPSEKFELNFRAGAQSGKGYDANLGLGAKRDKFYVQANLNWLTKDFLPLSQNFDTSARELDYQLDNSYRTDWKTNLKVGFTPNKTDEYSINYSYQHGEKGNSIYLGSDPNEKIRYWQWPFWDKQSLYNINRIKLSNNLYLKTRLYYDNFKNQLNAFDDATYSTQNKPSSFTSLYYDETYGAQAEFLYNGLKKNDLKLALQFKNDNHRENNLGEPVRHFADNIYSIALEDIMQLGKKLLLVPGLSFNYRESLSAEDYNSKTDSISQYNANSSQSVDAQIGMYYNLNAKWRFNFNIANKTRFATMNDRYSYKLGRAIPNPDLVPEKAVNIEIGAAIRPHKKLVIKPEIFYSHLTNTIQLVSNVDGNLSQMQNTGLSEFKGFDINLQFNASKFLNVYAIWSFIEQQNLSNPDILFRNIPKNRGMISIERELKAKLRFMITAEYNSERFSASDGSRIAPAYYLLNVNAGYKINKQMRVEGGVNNIFDRLYFVDEGYPEAGRNLFIAFYYDLQVK